MQLPTITFLKQKYNLLHCLIFGLILLVCVIQTMPWIFTTLNKWGNLYLNTNYSATELILILTLGITWIFSLFLLHNSGENEARLPKFILEMTGVTIALYGAVIAAGLLYNFVPLLISHNSIVIVTCFTLTSSYFTDKISNKTHPGSTPTPIKKTCAFIVEFILRPLKDLTIASSTILPSLLSVFFLLFYNGVILCPPINNFTIMCVNCFLHTSLWTATSINIFIFIQCGVIFSFATYHVFRLLGLDHSKDSAQPNNKNTGFSLKLFSSLLLAGLIICCCYTPLFQLYQPLGLCFTLPFIAAKGVSFYNNYLEKSENSIVFHILGFINRHLTQPIRELVNLDSTEPATHQQCCVLATIIVSSSLFPTCITFPTVIILSCIYFTNKESDSQPDKADLLYELGQESATLISFVLQSTYIFALCNFTWLCPSYRDTVETQTQELENLLGITSSHA